MPYLSTPEVETKLETLSLQYPTLCQRLTLPNTTHEGRTSHALRLRTGPRAIRPGVYLIGGVHAREWGSADILVHLAEALLGSYQGGTDVVLLGATYTAAQVRSILENVELLIFPVVNPDGRTYSQTVDIWWRKNRAPTPQPGVLGIDINRNYDFLWNYRQYFLPGYSPASDDPTWQTYHGTAVWSEAETRNVKHLADSHAYTRFFVDVHSYSELILYPWGDDASQTSNPTQDFRNAAYDGLRGNTVDLTYREYIAPVEQVRYQGLAQRLNQALGQVRGTAYTQGPGATTLYIVSGSSKDHMYSRHIVDRSRRKIDAFLFEWGRQFQPPYSEMSNIILDVSAALIELCLAAQEIPLLDKAPDPLDFGLVRTGSAKTLSVTIRNVGVGAAELFNIQVQGAGFTAPASTLSPVPEGASAQFAVTFASTTPGPAAGRLTFHFRQPGSAFTDMTDVLLSATGCSVAKDACTAPVFPPTHWLVCLLLWLAAPAILLIILILIWVPGMKCVLKRFLYRLNHCGAGNDNPCIML